jgi:hypothetical protein
MRPAHRHLLTAALLAAVLPACAEEASSPSDPGAPELATRIDVTKGREGRIHGHGSSWDNGHFLSHYDLNVTGVDADGVRYQGTSTGNGNVGDPIEDMVISTVINSTGGLPNFTTKIVLHHHKDGTVTVDKAGEECRG